MIMLPTHRRSDNLLRFIAAYGVTQATEPVLLLIDEDDRSYDEIILPSQFSILRIPPGKTASQRANIPFIYFPDEPYYAIMGDDVVPMTPHWDKILKEAAGDWNIAYCADGICDHRLATHPFIGGELVRAMGYVEEDMGDWYADNARMDIGRTLHLLRYVEEVKYDHLHHLNGKAEYDETYKKQKTKDRSAYERWRRKGYYETLSRITAYREGRIPERDYQNGVT